MSADRQAMVELPPGLRRGVSEPAEPLEEA